MFQVFIPSPERDKHIEEKTPSIYRFPNILDFQPSEDGTPQVGLLDLTSGTVIKGDVVTTVLTFGEMTHTSNVCATER